MRSTFPMAVFGALLGALGIGCEASGGASAGDGTPHRLCRAGKLAAPFCDSCLPD